MKYRDDFTPAERAQFERELEEENRMYATLNVGIPTDGDEEQMAAYEQSLDYFNRYIARDR